jgi:hypothetical protein
MQPSGALSSPSVMVVNAFISWSLPDIENDPDLTDRKFPGNPTMSYRSVHPLRVLAEVIGWVGHPAEQVNAMKAGLEKLKAEGVRSRNDEE